MKTLIVAITEDHNDQRTPRHMAANGESDVQTYTAEVNEYWPHEVLELIAYGLLFRENWRIEDKRLEWWLQ